MLLELLVVVHELTVLSARLLGVVSEDEIGDFQFLIIAHLL